MYGKTGAGKSTTGAKAQLLIKECTDPDYKISEKELFHAETSTEAVTTEPELKLWDNWRILDTPGYDDPKRDDLDTLK